jgi:putative peptidoglycan lipid II flippase
MNASQRQITRAAGVVMAAMALSSGIGLLRQTLIAGAFGTKDAADAYAIASRLPELLFNLAAGGALGSAFIPIFTGFLVKDDRANAWRLASGVLNLVFLILSATSLLAALFAPQLVHYVLATGLHDPAKFALTVQLVRWLLITPAIFGVSGLLMGILNAHQNFLLPALAPTFKSLGEIFGILALAPHYGIYGLAAGAVLGAGLHLLVQLPGLRGLPEVRYRPHLELGNPAVRDVIRLMGPRLLGVAAVQLNWVISVNLASFMTGGSIAALDYAWKTFLMPQAIIAQSISIAALPAFSALIALDRFDDMRASLADTLRGILFLALPATVGLFLLREPVIVMLYQHRIFNAQSTALAAWALGFYTLGLVGHSVVEILSRAFYSVHDTRTPVIVSVGAMGLTIGLNFIFAYGFTRLGWPPHGGLALGLTVGTTLEGGLLLWLMRRRLHGLNLRRLWPGLWRTALASALMGVVLAAWLFVTQGRSSWLIGLGGAAGGSLVFGIAAYGLGCPEARLFPKLVVERLRRKPPV